MVLNPRTVFWVVISSYSIVSEFLGFEEIVYHLHVCSLKWVEKNSEGKDSLIAL